MGVTLEQIRGRWERGLTPLVVMDHSKHFGMVLVILEGGLNVLDRNEDKKYHCHRYFGIMNDWVCSVDGQNVDLEAVWSWLNEPRADTTKIRHYIKPKPVQCEEE